MKGTYDFLKSRNQKANLNALENGVNNLIKMATQMTAGQPRKDNKGDIPYETIDMVKWQIIIEASALVLDEKWEEVKKFYDRTAKKYNNSVMHDEVKEDE